MHRELSRPFRENHQHVQLISRRATACQVYPPALREAFCRGIAKQKAWDAGGLVSGARLGKRELYSLMSKVVDPEVAKKLRTHSRHRPAARPIVQWPGHWVDHMHEHDGGEDKLGERVRDGVEELRKHMDALYRRGGMPEAWDDMNGVFLDPSLVAAARKEEMAFFRKLGVYKRVPREMVAKLGGKMISVKWLDTNKGDKARPNYRSRLVARESNLGRDDAVYASTPPLEALRLIVSHAATSCGEHAVSCGCMTYGAHISTLSNSVVSSLSCQTKTRKLKKAK